MAECRIPAAGHLGNDSLVERPSQRTGTGAASPLLIVLAGLPGSGKSAFRERWLRGVAGRAAWVALSTDDLVEAAAIRAGSTYDAVKRDEAKPADKAFRHALREALERRANVIVDRTNLTPAARRRLAARAPAEYRKLCYWFEVPESERRDRLTRRPGKTIPPHVDADMRERWAKPGADEGFDAVIRADSRLLPDAGHGQQPAPDVTSGLHGPPDNRTWQPDAFRRCSMQVFSHPDHDSHEQVVFVREAAAGLTAIVAIHSTALGPALGGCRIWDYPSEDEALTDVLRLSRGMTYKAALAGLPLGGGKSVVLADPRAEKTPAMMRAMGRAVERLGGRYIVAEDVGATVADMDEIARETTHVSGTSANAGDPSPWTARGVFLSMQAGAIHCWGVGLEGRTVTVAGLGNVGSNLCNQLAGAGAHLIVSDIREDAVRRIVDQTGARVVAPEAAHAAEADVFAPCALGAVLNERTIPEIRARLVCGAANNQLATAADGERLAARGILYAPDYLVNAGGLISVARAPLGLSDAGAEAKLEAIPETLLGIFRAAEKQGVTPAAAADRMAESRFRSAA